MPLRMLTLGLIGGLSIGSLLIGSLPIGSLLAAAPAVAQSQQQPERAPQDVPGGSEPVERAAPAPPALPPALPPAGAAAGEPRCPCEPRPHGEDATEYWPPIRGYRLKITDTLIAGLIALLLWAVWLQGRASRRLVAEAMLSAERQQRAYLAVVPRTIAGVRPNSVGTIEWVIRNLGQTPARQVRPRYNWAVLPNPLPSRHKFAKPAREFPNTFAVMPRDETVSYFEGDAAFTAEQIEAISRNEARLYCWGHTEYQDVFGATWRTGFSVSAGGEAFTRAMTLPADHPSAPRWSWDYGSGHNDIEEA